MVVECDLLVSVSHNIQPTKELRSLVELLFNDEDKGQTLRIIHEHLVEVSQVVNIAQVTNLRRRTLELLCIISGICWLLYKRC